MGKDEAFDIYSWILSPEIREWMRKRPHMSITDQATIVYHAYRSVEDNLQAMTWLLARAEEGEEWDCLEQAAAYLRFAVRQMEDREHGGPGRRDGQEESFRAEIAHYLHLDTLTFTRDFSIIAIGGDLYEECKCNLSC